MMPPATERLYFWMIDGQSKELDYTTSPAFDAVIKILRCQAAVVITDQSDMPVSLDLFDVTKYGVCCYCRQPVRERLAFANDMLDEILDSADKPFEVNHATFCLLKQYFQLSHVLLILSCHCVSFSNCVTM